MKTNENELSVRFLKNVENRNKDLLLSCDILMSKEIQRKVREYETFLNDRLQNDLRRAWDERDRLFSEIAEYERLRTTLNTFEELYQQRQTTKNEDPIQTQIDLGCSFFVQAECPLNNRIFISMGFGLYCELSYSEGKSFIEKKLPHLREQEMELSKKIGHIKANIKLVLEALKEIQSIDDKSSKINLK